MEGPQTVAIHLQLPKFTGVGKLCESSFTRMLQFRLFVYSLVFDKIMAFEDTFRFPTIMALLTHSLLHFHST